jgi:two-component system, NtrC family, sensor kinase
LRVRREAWQKPPARAAKPEGSWFYNLILGAVLVPVLVYAAVAWWDRISVLNQAERMVQITAKVNEEHARNVFETHRLVASLVNEHIRGMSWQEIADSKPLHDYLAEMVHAYPQINSIWLVDPTGLVRNAAKLVPASPVSAADRDYFIELRDRKGDTFIGQPVRGRVLNENIFNVAQRRLNASGEFDGVVVVSALQSYFVDFWRTSGSQNYTASLVRQDGTYIARTPETTLPRLPESSPFMQAMSTGDHGGFRTVSVIDGSARIYAFRKVSGFPLYATYGLAIGSALQTWRDHLIVYGLFFVVGTLGLESLAIIAVLWSRREAKALRYWRETAEELNEEIERRAAVERQLRQAQKMEALGQITGGMAHDFNNILSVVVGNLELFLGGKSGEVTPLTRALDAANRGMKAIRSMLSFAKQQPQHSEVFDLNAALQDMDALLHPAVGSGIELQIVPSTVPCRVNADRNQTELAILNLVLNARDAMPNGGKITILAKAVHGTDERSVGQFAAVTVKDNGAGIPPDVLAHVFEPFYTTKGPEKGTGLGLSMVYGFAEQSHGEVTIDSVVGQGTAVVLYLPLAPLEDHAEA